MLILLGSWTLPYSTDSPLLTFFFFFHNLFNVVVVSHFPRAEIMDHSGLS